MFGAKPSANPKVEELAFKLAVGYLEEKLTGKP